MFFTRVLHKISGYINFKLQGGNPEKFLNLCAKNHISVFEISKDDFGLNASSFEKNEKKLREISKKCGTEFILSEKKGVPVIFERHRKRWGFFVGIILFAAIIVYFSGFIWSVEVDGNSETETREILYVLNDLGVSPGVRMGTFDAKSVEQQAILKLPNLSWMHINFDGNVAKVEVGERTDRPQLVADSIPCNITAACDAQIINVQVRQGKAMVKPNDTIRAGEVIVSGVIEEPKTSLTRYVHARATIVARTNRELTVEVPYKTSSLEDTGKVVKRYAIDFLNVQLPLYWSVPEGKYRRMVYRNPIRLGSLELPIAWRTTAFYEYNEVPATLTKAEAQARAKELLKQKEETELAGVSIKDKSYTEKASKNGISYSGKYICEEDIGVMQEVNVSFD